MAKILDRFGSPINRAGLSGLFKFRCFDRHGNFKWEQHAKNAAVNEGMNHMLNSTFNGLGSVNPWYIGLINNVPAPTLAATDTAAQIGGSNGWTEFTGFTGGLRLDWTEGAASGQSITNATSVDFAITTGATIFGAFLASVSSGTLGFLWGTGGFASPQLVAVNDTLQVTYTVSLAPTP